MKLTIAILLISLVQVSAKGFSQTKVTLKLTDVELKKVLVQIENKTDCRFLYNDDAISQINPKVNINVENMPVTDVLNKLFTGINLTYKVLSNNLIVLSSRDNFIQDVKITGKVTGSNGEPVPSATIRVKGSNVVKTADANGNFTIVAPENATLIISSVGFNQIEVAIGGRKEMIIALKESEKVLDQVVVVGYGSQRKIDVTGAVASVKGEELVKQPVLTATQAIQGKVAGVQITSSGQPGSQPSIRIRGTGSILGGAEPLYVVDGVITNDITNINNADITNIDILKDASSCAIYGARGANGVILITTRQGTSGRMQINYSGNVGIQSATHVVKMANATEYANYITQANYGLQPLKPTSFSTDWYSQILRTAVESNSNISISGATDKTKYLFSVGYSDNEGIVLNNEYKRFTLRGNDEFKLADNLKLGVNVSYQNSNNLIPNLGSAYNDAYRAAPVIQSRVDGKYGNTSLYQNVGNPILDINNMNSKTQDNRLQGNIFLDYKPVKWLTLRSQLNAEWDNNDNTSYTYAFAADTSTFLVAGGNQSNLHSGLSVNTSNYLHWVWDNTATFSQRFDQHNITVLVGTTAQKQTSSYLNGSAEGVPSASNLWYLGNANLTLPYSVSSGAFAGTPATYNSYLARVNYSYANKYLFTGTARADASSNFPVSNHWGYFPSVGAGWVVSNENFMRNQHIFEILKLRASWGESGNDFTSSGTSGYTTTLLTNLPYFFAGSAVTGSIPSSIVDKNLKWETSTESDVAVEFSVLRSRLTGEFSYYSKVTSNSLIDVLVPSTLGSYNPGGLAGYVLTNAASVQNRGVELALNWKDKLNKNFSYSIGANITFNKNNVVGLNGGQAVIDGAVGADQPYVTKTDVGHPIGSFYVQKVLGVYQTGLNAGNFNYELGKNTGQPDSVYAGSYQPKAYYGVNLGFRYKNFDLSLTGYGTAGGKIYNGKKGFRQSLQDNLEASVANGFWTSANKSNSEPSAHVLSGELPASTYFVESGSFFRINNLNIGYTIPADVVKRSRVFTSFRVYVSGQNLFTFTKYSGFSPEIQPALSPTGNNSGTPPNLNATAAGIEMNAYPSVRTMSLGVNIGF